MISCESSSWTTSSYPGKLVFVIPSFSFLPSFGSRVYCPVSRSTHIYCIYLIFLIFYLFVRVNLVKSWGDSVPALVPFLYGVHCIPSNYFAKIGKQGLHRFRASDRDSTECTILSYAPQKWILIVAFSNHPTPSNSWEWSGPYVVSHHHLSLQETCSLSLRRHGSALLCDWSQITQ